MTSLIDPTVPPDNVQVDKATLRANFLAAKTEIEALQAAGIGPASETAAGTARIATTAEVTTATADNLIVTPLKLQQRLTSYLPGNFVAKAGAQTMEGPLTVTNGDIMATTATHMMMGDIASGMGFAWTGDHVNRFAVFDPNTNFAYNTGTGLFQLTTNNQARITVDSAGFIGINGAPNPPDELIIRPNTNTGSNNTSLTLATVVAAATSSLYLVTPEANMRVFNNAGVFTVHDGTNTRMTITTSGASTLFGTSLTVSGVNPRIQLSASSTQATHAYYIAGVLRAENGYDSTNNRWFINMYNTSGVYQSTIISATASAVGVGIIPVYPLHVYNAAYAEGRIETGVANNAALTVKNTTREWALINQGSDGQLRVWDSTAGRSVLDINTSGAAVFPTSVGIRGAVNPGVFFQVNNTGTSMMALVSSGSAQSLNFHMQDAGYHWEIIKGPDNHFRIRDDNAGAADRLFINSVTGEVAICGTPMAAGVTLSVRPISGQAIVYVGDTGGSWADIRLQNSFRHWGMQCMGSGFPGAFRLFDATSGKDRLLMDTNGVLHLKTGSTILYDLAA